MRPRWREDQTDRIDRVGRSVGALKLQGTRQLADSGARQLKRQVVERGTGALGALERRVAIDLEGPAADPFAAGRVQRAFAHDAGGASGRSTEDAAGEAGGEQLDRRGRHERLVGIHTPEHRPD